MAAIPVLSDVKAHLRYPTANVADDVAITGFLAASIGALRAEVGDIKPTQCDEYHNGGHKQIWLRHSPILEIFQVEEGWGFTNYNLAEIQVNSPTQTQMFAFSVDETETGLISRRVGGNVNIPFVPGVSNIHVTYSAGRSAISDNLRLAILELTAHFWQGSQQRHGSTGGGISQYDTVNVDFTRASGLTAINQGVPYRIIELLKGDRRMPIIG